MNYIYSSKKKEKRFLIKNIFSIHPLVYFFSIIAVMAGDYREYIIISTLIIIHEFGHFLCAKTFGIETDKIYIYPLGGISKFHMMINCNPIKEFMILIMGPIFQNIAFLILSFFFSKEIVSPYHIGILVFNLLPIYPLDGGKLFNLGINVFIPFRKSFQISIVISYVIAVVILFMNHHLSINMILTYVFLLFLIRKEEMRIPFYYHKFLLERFLYSIPFSKKKLIFHSHSFYRYYYNILKDGEKQVGEKEFLYKKYGNFRKKC